MRYLIQKIQKQNLILINLGFSVYRIINVIKRHKIIEHGKEEAIKKITDEEIKSQCAESGFLIYFCFQLNFISKKFQ